MAEATQPSVRDWRDWARIAILILTALLGAKELGGEKTPAPSNPAPAATVLVIGGHTATPLPEVAGAK